MRSLKRRIGRFVESRLAGDWMVNLFGRGRVNLIDVGSVGALPKPWSSHLRDVRHLLKFEPRERAARGRSSVTSRDVALWRENCERDFYIYVSGTGSSLFEQNEDFVRQNFEELSRRGPRELAHTWFERSKLERVERVQCRTLDSVIDELNVDFDFHFLKVDAQGAEFEILQGAQRFLARDGLGLHLELFTVPLYSGITLLPQVVEWLDERGYELVIKYPAHGSFDSQHDCVFLKRTDAPLLRHIERIYHLR